MRKAFRKNLIPKTVSLVMAVVIWNLIRLYLIDRNEWQDYSAITQRDIDEAPKARVATEEELRKETQGAGNGKD